MKNVGETSHFSFRIDWALLDVLSPSNFHRKSVLDSLLSTITSFLLYCIVPKFFHLIHFFFRAKIEKKRYCTKSMCHRTHSSIPALSLKSNVKRWGQ